MPRAIFELDAVVAVRAVIPVYFDGVVAVGYGNAKMREYEKALLVKFDTPISPNSVVDRSRWQVEDHSNNTVVLPVSVALVSTRDVMLSLPTLQPGHDYTLHYDVFDQAGLNTTGTIPFFGI